MMRWLAMLFGVSYTRIIFTDERSGSVVLQIETPTRRIPDFAVPGGALTDKYFIRFNAKDYMFTIIEINRIWDMQHVLLTLELRVSMEDLNG